MSEIRYELILRVPNLSAESVDLLKDSLLKLAGRLAGTKLSIIEREHYSDGSAMHVARHKIL